MKWEYRLTDLPVPESRDEMEQVDATLNEFGALGWEAVSASIEGDQAILVSFKAAKLARYLPCSASHLPRSSSLDL